jgi:hypothetical protein
MSCNGFARKDPIEVFIRDYANLDGFQRLPIAEPVTLFDNQHQYDTLPLLFETTLAGGATEAHLPNESAVRLRCGTANGDLAVRQSRAYFRYQPGKAGELRFTRLWGAAVSGVRRRSGFFDADNGLFLEQTGSGLSWVVRSKTSGSVVDTAIAQASWNKDKLDGTGPSGYTLDITKTIHIVIKFEWLGVGGVLFGFDFGNEFVLTHHFVSPNVLTTPYMTTANLPIRNEVENTTGQASSHDLNVICNTVISSGGFEAERGYDFGSGNLAEVAGIGTGAWVPLVSIRPKATFNSITNRGQIIPEFVEVLVGSGSAAWALFYNPASLTGASFASADADSITEVDTSATAITGGVPTARGFGSGGAGAGGRLVHSRDYSTHYPLTLDIAGANPRVLTLAARSLSGTIGAAGALNWREHR